MIEGCRLDKQKDSLLDVGSGATTLLRALLERGYQHIHAEDVTVPALHNALPEVALWHDQAVFHFLTEAEQRFEVHMQTTPASHPNPLWIYTVLPVVILNVGAIVLFGGYYGLRATQPELVANIQPDQVQFLVYVFIFIVEWIFAILLLKQQASKGITLVSLIAPDCQIWKFKWLPTLALFVIFNLLFIIYIPLISLIYGQWPRLDNLLIWQRLFIVLAVPLQAAFCEELIWRGHIIPELKARGRSDFAAILLSAASFALIHGIFLIDKLLLTLILGLITGLYYLRERHLLPLMISHLIADVWTFALSVC